MLRPGDIGAGYTAVPYTKPPSRPQPCGQPDVDTVVKPYASAGAEAANDAGRVAWLEEANSYTSVTDASKAFQLSEQGVACGSGSLYDAQGNAVPATFGPATDVNAQVGATAAVEISFTTDTVKGTAVLVRSGTIVYTVLVQMAPEVDPSAVPDPVAVAKTAQAQIAKIS
jgi:hypothetical protein